MPKSTNRNRKIPKFIKKLYEIVQDSKNQNLVAWLPEGRGFQILNTSRFIEQVLPNYFRHKNMASFVRQLNMYGFSRPKDSSQHVYIHARFIKGNMNSIRQIQRKAHESTTEEVDAMIEEDQSSAENEAEQSGLKLDQLCLKLLEQNQKLKKQNQQLNLKLNQIKKNKQIIESFPIFACVAPDAYYYKNIESNNLINNEETTVQKSQQNLERRQMHSFNFWENNSDKGSRLSYLSLINGATNKDKDGASEQNKNNL